MRDFLGLRTTVNSPQDRYNIRPITTVDSLSREGRVVSAYLHSRASLLPVVVAPAVVVIAGLLAMLLRTSKAEREDFIIPGSSDLPITGSPIESAVHDRWPVDYAAPARKVPQDFPAGRIQRVHLS